MSVMNKLCGLFTLTMITVMTAPTSAGDVRLGDLTISQPLTRASTNKARPGAAPNIPDKVSRKARHCFSKALYKERNHVERFFNMIKHFRCIATGFEKHAAKYLALI